MVSLAWTLRLGEWRGLRVFVLWAGVSVLWWGGVGRWGWIDRHWVIGLVLRCARLMKCVSLVRRVDGLELRWKSKMI